MKVINQTGADLRFGSGNVTYDINNGHMEEVKVNAEIIIQIVSLANTYGNKIKVVPTEEEKVGNSLGIKIISSKNKLDESSVTVVEGATEATGDNQVMGSDGKVYEVSATTDSGEASQDFQTALKNEQTRVDNMINQINENINVIVAQLNKNMADGFNTINGGVDTIRQDVENLKSRVSTLEGA